MKFILHSAPYHIIDNIHQAGTSTFFNCCVLPYLSQRLLSVLTDLLSIPLHYGSGRCINREFVFRSTVDDLSFIFRTSVIIIKLPFVEILVCCTAYTVKGCFLCICLTDRNAPAVCSSVCSWLLCCGILAAALSLHPVRVIASANAAPVKIHFFLILFLILHIRLECVKCSRYPARLQVKFLCTWEI